MTVKPDEIEMEGFPATEDLVNHPDDLLPPAARLEKFADSDLLFARQNAARSLLETLQCVVSNEDEVNSVISVLCKLSDDSEPTIRTELMEQIPHIAIYCREHGHILGNVIRQQLVPLIVKFLTDSNDQVRKTSQSSLVFLTEQGLIHKGQLEEWICPFIAQLTDSSDVEDQRNEAVALMSKMATLVGKETTEKLFLQRFCTLCLDSSFYIRKTCAYNFGEFCAVVGREATENFLLSNFCNLCEDQVWGVRKACAEVFMPVSCVVSMETRRNELGPLFIGLLCDESRWVTAAAFQALGPFISTFADPSKTGLKYSQDGVLVVDEKTACNIKNSAKEKSIINCDSFESALTNIKTDPEVANSIVNQLTDTSKSCVLSDSSSSSSLCESSSAIENHGDGNSFATAHRETNSIEHICDILEENLSADKKMESSSVAECVASSQNVNSSHSSTSETIGVFPACDVIHESPLQNSPPSQKEETHGVIKEIQRRDSNCESPFTVTAKDGHLHFFIDNEGAFNHFQFWRIPIPEVELDIDIEEGKATNIHVRARVHDEAHHQLCLSDLNVKVAPSPNDHSTQMEGVASELTKVHIANQNSSEALLKQDCKKIQVQTACINTITDVFDAGVGDEGDKSLGKVHVLNSRFNEANVTVTHGEISDLMRTRMSVCNTDGDDMMEMAYFLPHSISANSLTSNELHLTVHDQDIVPPELLEHYIGMADPMKSHTVDGEITCHCAYSLPAVALTLGRKYWPCLKDTYDALASDMQWKVRRTLASGMHELAVILGSDLTVKDLLPVVSGLLRDLDEVRIGLLQHLSQFLQLLRPPEQRDFLPHLAEFLKLDNTKNWRFRLTLVEQLVPTTDLYNPADIKEHLIPLAMCLVRDKVCEVRMASIKLIAAILRKFSQSQDQSLVKWLLNELEEHFKHAPKWVWRQMYVLLCQQFVLENSLPQDQFIQEIVPKLLSLSWDNVPNVRLVVARCLAQTLLPLDYFPSIQCSHYQLLLQVVYSLQSDIDRDVRSFAHISAEAFNILPQKVVLPI